MPTSCTKLVRNGVKTIVTADTTIQSLTGKTSNILLPWETALVAVKPIGAIMVSANNRVGGDGDKRRVQVIIGWFAEGTGAQTKVDDLTQRTREILTPARFAALTPAMDAVVLEWTDRDGTGEVTDTTPTNVASTQLDFIVLIQAPQT